jgi:NAD(P)H-quinone oxidoreductase subunit 4
VISCLLVPIIGIGLYPRLITDSYRASIEALVGREMAAMSRIQHPPGAAVMRPSPFGLLPVKLLQAPVLPPGLRPAAAG